MNELKKTNQFIETGDDHESSALSDLVFKDIDYRKFNNKISFYRSDFSRSRFFNCYYYNNIFGRADFIDTVICNCMFEHVDYGSCLIKNSVVEKTIFKNNNYKGVAIQYSYFSDCTFRNEKFITNMYYCDFYECTFINCTFERSSLDNNTFTNCEFVKVDMSECIAEELKFNNCALRDVYLCANLWTTYLFKKTDVYNFGFKYRGNIVDIWNGSNSKAFLKTLYEKALFFEYLNTVIISSSKNHFSIVNEFKRIIPLIISEPAQIRKSTFIRIFDMLYFYRNDEKLTFEQYVSIFCFLSNYSFSNIDFDEEIEYRARLFKIQKTIENLDFDYSYIKSISPVSKCIAKIHINTEDYDSACEYIENLFDIANRDCCNNLYEKPLITIIQNESGSIILTIASTTLLVLLISYVAKKVFHNIFSIQIDNKIKKQIIKQIENSKSHDSLKESCLLAKSNKFTSDNNDIKQIKDISTEITKSEILDIIISLLF